MGLIVRSDNATYIMCDDRRGIGCVAETPIFHQRTIEHIAINHDWLHNQTTGVWACPICRKMPDRLVGPLQEVPTEILLESLIMVTTMRHNFLGTETFSSGSHLVLNEILKKEVLRRMNV